MTEDTKKTPVALQLFSVRGECKNDLPATLKAVAEMGYAGAEPWGYAGDTTEWMGRNGTDLRKMFDDNGLRCCGIHLQTGALLGDNLARTIDLNQALGNTFLIIAADKGRMSAVDSIRELADILNGVSEKLKPLGMATGYHAHGFDFERFDGKTAWELLFGQTNDDVIMQLDIGNCANGGGDPIAMLERFPGRARSLHLKDYDREPGAALGEGKADWTKIFRLCDTLHKPEWYVVEEGGKDGLGFDVCRKSLDALKGMGIG
ncbi:MAG: sugar phosphate isomerase/epimerase [Kiritimatiellae bacterium]|nr:sugar phosphate isomerase/epimerase [Kiritimatiellia bacterium]